MAKLESTPIEIASAATDPFQHKILLAPRGFTINTVFNLYPPTTVVTVTDSATRVCPSPRNAASKTLDAASPALPTSNAMKCERPTSRAK